MSKEVSAPRRHRRGSGAVTLHDVAKLAGVAPITASRAVNHPGQVSDEVRKKVGDAIARTGYVPNRLAGGLASARSRLVAAVVPGVLSYGAYSYLQRELGASRTAMMLYLAPVYGALLGWLLLGELPGWYHAVGAAMILPSIWLASHK